MNLASEGIKMIREAIMSKGLHASGRTANSLKGEDTGSRVVIYSDGSGAPAFTLQRGRPAGRIPFNFHGIIRQWALDKGIQVDPIPFSTERPRPDLRKYDEQERGLRKFSWSVSQKIKREGTRRHHKNRDDIYTPAQEFVYREFVKRCGDAIINEYLK